MWKIGTIQQRDREGTGSGTGKEQSVGSDRQWTRAAPVDGNLIALAVFLKADCDLPSKINIGYKCGLLGRMCSVNTAQLDNQLM